ncbi:hypothetical protein ONR75_03485 [Rhodopseudomonas sp. P2A-2r]|uniref:hypothetical protein n=1 Tax=Rhodopseudomonas sp. P2A-2r TaxID=2991972 RepID=UPI002234B64E|nr:hypothetical protein [Rhodopseudomonas sp. P2A-2r]UZE49867.1 hypothetical protein ONR75_03485 [Rhodopseudomonas sp. P2A-2r]
MTLTNQAGASISGGTNGVVSTAGAITVDNAGSITATSGAAIDALIDITVINRAGGVISGGPSAIFARGGNVTLDNAGSITSAGTTVSAFDRVALINRAGATISGSIIGANGVDVNNSGHIDILGGPNLKVVNTGTGSIGNIFGLGAPISTIPERWPTSTPSGRAVWSIAPAEAWATLSGMAVLSITLADT